MNTYRQCALNRTVGSTVELQVSWLPSRFAACGNVLRLRERGGEWEDGWVVTFCGSEEREESELRDPRKDFRLHRRATGDDTPKVRRPA